MKFRNFFCRSFSCRALCCLWLTIFATGCLTNTRTYQMSVRNELRTPVSVCLTKTYGPLEHGWEAPEDLAGPPHAPSDQIPPGTVIPPGKTVNHPPFTGRFDPSRGRAVLRIYAGTPTLTQMTAMSSGSLDRVDVPLEEGMNYIDIRLNDDGSLTAVHVQGPWPATQPAVSLPAIMGGS